MPTYTTQVKCYIEGSLRKAGSTFTITKTVKPIPKWLKEVKLSKIASAKAAKAAKVAAAKLAADEETINQLTNDTSNKFLGDSGKVEVL